MRAVNGAFIGMTVSRRTLFKRFCAAVALGVVAATDLAMLARTANAQGKGKGGGGKGNAGGNGKAGGNGNSAGKGGGAAAPAGGPGANTSAAPSNAASVVHSNGMRESVLSGRYEMRDAQGRVIVERRATRADYTRLKVLP
jgi:hypothetical protein